MKKFALRSLSLLFGNILYAFGIVITIRASIGYAPWEVFHVGVALVSGMSIGVTSIVAGIVIVAIVTISGEKIGFGTIISMLLTGMFIDLIIFLDVIPAVEGYVKGIIMLIAGLFVLSFGAYFYIKSAFGAGPRDNLMVVLTRKTKLPVGVCRSMVELTVTIVGWLLGGMVGVGTVISVIGVGFCIQLTFTILKFDATAVEHETLMETYRSFRRDR